MDVLKKGQIGGYCKLNETKLNEESLHLSPLQSWGPEMQHFEELSQKIQRDSPICDVYIDKPTFIMKIDASEYLFHLSGKFKLHFLKKLQFRSFYFAAVNMYHHFCDFFNLYTSLHVNGTHKDMFSRDVNILIWETYSYFSNFGVTWSAFTTKPTPWNLRTFQGKRVCFREVVFPLLPRMIFGLYYNTPVVWGCKESGLFHAFSKFILHRLKVPKRAVKIGEEPVIKITLLSRNTQFRRILNEKELIDKLKSSPRRFVVNKVVDITHCFI